MILAFDLPWIRGIPSGTINMTKLFLLTSVIGSLTKRMPYGIQPNTSPYYSK